MDRERFSGSLIGQCLGDALGFPVEGSPPGACAIYVDHTLRRPAAERLARPPYPFGQYTNSGVGWEEAGELPPAAGDGSAMRAGPVGLLFHDDRTRLLRVAHDQGRITHRDPRCSAGSVAIASAVALALEDAPVEVTRWARRLADDARPHDAGFADALLRLPEWVALPPDRVVTAIPHRLGQPYSEYHWDGVSPFVVSSVLWSLYAFLRTPDDYWETICAAIAVGGDVDTTAAMAGAVSGARVGLSGLPLDLARALTDQGTWGCDDLVALAHQCHACKHG